MTMTEELSHEEVKRYSRHLIMPEIAGAYKQHAPLFDPLLPLDGGHVAVAVYERLRSRGGERYYADVGKLLPIVYAVVFILITVGVAALYLDITDPVI